MCDKLSHSYIILRDIPRSETSHRYIISRDILYRKTSHRYIILRNISRPKTSHRYIISRDIPRFEMFHRYTISRDIPVKAWQKRYFRDILYQLEGWLIKNLIYRPIPRVDWEAYNPYQLISFRSLILSILFKPLLKQMITRVIYNLRFVRSTNTLC